MVPLRPEIINIKNQIVEKYRPADIILFGSQAKGQIRRGSDVDLCVIMETRSKREIIADMLMSIESESDLDIIVYTPAEWAKYKNNMATFPGLVNRTGVSLIG